MTTVSTGIVLPASIVGADGRPARRGRRVIELPSEQVTSGCGPCGTLATGHNTPLRPQTRRRRPVPPRLADTCPHAVHIVVGDAIRRLPRLHVTRRVGLAPKLLVRPLALLGQIRPLMTPAPSSTLMPLPCPLSSYYVLMSQNYRQIIFLFGLMKLVR